MSSSEFSEQHDQNAVEVTPEREKNERISSNGLAASGVTSYASLFRSADGVDVLLMVMGVVGAAGNGATLACLSLFFGNLIDGFGENLADPAKLQQQVNSSIINLVLVGAGTCVAAYLQISCWNMTAVRQVNRFRFNYLKATFAQEIGFFDTKGTSGALLQGLIEDCSVIQQGIGEKLSLFIVHISIAIAGVIIAFVRGWDMTLVTLAVLPVLAGGAYAVSSYYIKFNSVVTKSYGDANAHAKQALSNIRTVYSFNGHDATTSAYSASLRAPMKVGMSQGFLGGLISGMTYLVMFGAYALAMWYGGEQIIKNKYTGGTVLNVLFSFVTSGYALGQAIPNLQYFQQAKAAGSRVFSIIHRKPKMIAMPEGALHPEHQVLGCLEFQNVSFAYPARPETLILKGFSLKIPASTSVALVGESGSGKSTIVSLVERFYDPYSGHIILDGLDIKELCLPMLRRLIGLVNQEPALFATSILDNILFGKPDATRDEVIAASRLANAHNFIMDLPQGYDTQVGERGLQMSGGQKQRIAIARALLKQPKILLLDEATSALDNESEALVQQALENVMGGCTAIVVAHRLSTIAHLDNIAVMKDGMLVEQGTHAELIQQGGVYGKMISLQTKRTNQNDRNIISANMDMAQSGGALQSIAVLADCSDGQPSTGVSNEASNKEGFVGVPGNDQCTTPDKAMIFKEDVRQEASLLRLIRISKPEVPALLAGLAASAALGLIMPVCAITFSSLINVFFLPDTNEIRAGLRTWCLVFLGLGVGSMLVSVVQRYFLEFMGQKLVFRLRVMMMSSMLRQEVAWFDKEENKSGILVNKLSVDTLGVKAKFGDSTGLLIQNLVNCCGGIVIAFISGWKMTLVVLATIPLVFLALTIQTKIMVAATLKEEDTFAKANQSAVEGITGVRTVAAFNMEQPLLALYDKKLREPTKEAFVRAHTAGVGLGFGQFSMYGSLALAFWFGGVQVKEGGMSFENMLKVVMAIFMAANGSIMAQLSFPDMTKGSTAAQRVFCVIDRKPHIDASSGDGLTLQQCYGAFELKDVVFSYPSRPEMDVFSNFNLTIPAQKTTALVGESGGGKSTVIGLLERFYDPKSGQVILDGFDIRCLNLRWLRDQIALVSQEPVLFNMTVAENIRYGRPEANMESIMEAARTANAHNFIEALPDGYDTKLGEGGIQLSGGQKQRVALARAVVKDPKILLLDEATSALDTESEALVQEALNHLMHDRTTLVIAHRLSTVRNADMIAVISRGRVVEQGSHENLLMQNGAYSQLVKMENYDKPQDQLQGCHSASPFGQACVRQTDHSEPKVMRNQE